MDAIDFLRKEYSVTGDTMLVDVIGVNMKLDIVIRLMDKYADTKQKLNIHGVMQGLQLNLPSMGEVSDAIEMLAKKSTAPDAETPDWLKADIRNGINWALNYVTKHNTSTTVASGAVGQNVREGKWDTYKKGDELYGG